MKPEISPRTLHAAKLVWTSVATEPISSATPQTGRSCVAVDVSTMAKARAGAARQLHSRANAGAPGQCAAGKRARRMQAIDIKQLIHAQKFSNPIRGAPMLSPTARTAWLSTKLSTAAVDDAAPFGGSITLHRRNA